MISAIIYQYILNHYEIIWRNWINKIINFIYITMEFLRRGLTCKTSISKSKILNVRYLFWFSGEDEQNASENRSASERRPEYMCHANHL